MKQRVMKFTGICLGLIFLTNITAAAQEENAAEFSAAPKEQIKQAEILLAKAEQQTQDDQALLQQIDKLLSQEKIGFKSGQRQKPQVAKAEAKETAKQAQAKTATEQAIEQAKATPTSQKQDSAPDQAILTQTKMRLASAQEHQQDQPLLQEVDQLLTEERQRIARELEEQSLRESKRIQMAQLESRELLPTEQRDEGMGYEEKPSLNLIDSFDKFVDELNANLTPVKISGEFTLSLGSTSAENIIWKDANGDYNETNWRRIHSDFGINTYDRRIYDRLRVNIDTEYEDNFNVHANITIDPWSFVGKTDAVNISSITGERANIQLKYWSNNRSIINENYLTLQNGASLTIPETKVVDGKVASMIVTNTWGEQLVIPELEIHRELWPLREFWVDYDNGDDFNFRFFPIAYQDQALSSDDPLQLSNHMIYWEESPWLDRWQPGVLNVGATPVDFSQGEWEDDLSFFTRDSNMARLTSLRGFSVESALWENVTMETTIASPKGLWQDYEAVDNVEGATRIKFNPDQELQMGFLHTFRYGLQEGKRDAENQVISTDLSYQFSPDVQMKGQLAYSHDKRDLTQEPYDTKNVGNAYRFELKRGKVQEDRPEAWFEESLHEEGFEEDISFGEVEPFDWAFRLRWTHMDKGFYPALASYRITRKDPFWGRHIHFKRPLKYYYAGLFYPSITWYDIRAQRLGDSVDINRDTTGLRLEKSFLDQSMNALLDVRSAHEASSGKYIETVARIENEWQANENLLVKFLGLYHDLPSTTGGIDPIIYDVDTNQFLLNSEIADGQDPSLKTVSGGFKYDFFDWLSFDFIYERTNDFTVALDDYPRALLNNSTFTTTEEDNLTWREVLPFLYSQGYFPTPPYPWFNIYKAGIEYEPHDDLKIRLEFTKNDYKYASQIDDNINHTGLDIKYNITEKLVLTLNYTYAKSHNLWKQVNNVDGGALEYESHHNVFVNFDYEFDDKGVFSLQFGEAAFLPYVTVISTSPYGGFLPTLDTQHIVRAYFSRKF